MNRKLVCTGIDALEVKEDPIPDTPLTGVIVKVCYAGLCHTDLHIYHDAGAMPPESMPRVLGHEISGTVHSVGKEYSKEAGALKVGERVVAFTWGGCLECAACKAGYNDICSNKHGPHTESFGMWNDGGYQQYLEVKNPWRLVKVPEGADLALSSIVPCSGITGLNAIELCSHSIDRAIKIKGYANVLGNGAGALCLWFTELIKARYGDKVRLCVTDLLEEKLEDVLAKGADLTLCLSRESGVMEVVGQIMEKFGGQGVDAAIDFVNTPATQERLFNSLADGGIQVFVGVFGNTMAPLNSTYMIIRQNQLQGCYAGSKAQVTQVLAMMASKKVKGPPISIIKFEEIETTMKSMLAGSTYRGRYVVEICKP